MDSTARASERRPAAAPYPSRREADVVLRDGSTVHVRPVRAGDQEALAGFLGALSEESRVLRFFSGGASVAAAAEAAADVDYRDRYGLVATVGDRGGVVGHAGYVRSGRDRAEVAFEIADRLQGRGLATILLAHLAEWAEELGIEIFEAEVRPENHRMIEVFRESGFPVRTRPESGSIVFEFPASLSPEAHERFERRDDVAAVAAAAAFLEPSSVAVLGASRRRGTVGGELFHNLVAGGFSGPVYPVNPQADSVQSVAAYERIDQVPGEVELALVAVPAESVVESARQCGAAGVRALVVISAGFGEAGEDGEALQRELVEVCRRYGMRLVGPNCMGVLNTDPEVSLHATFAPTEARPGRVALLSQSGALGLAAIDFARERDLGLSSFVSVGNKADVSGNDLLRYWERDGRTGVVLLYLESFGNPRKFARIARQMARTKPIVAVKAGRSPAGARAASSHTGAMLAASDVTVDALFRQAGVIRTDTLSELFDVAALLERQPPPEGPRVAIITNAGGLGIVCADASAAIDLDVVELPPSVQRDLAAGLPPAATVTNPVDTLAAASADDYRRALETVARSGAVDAVIALFIPPLAGRSEDVPAAVADVCASGDLPVPVAMAVVEGGRGSARSAGTGSVPRYEFPEEAARAMGLAARYGSWRRAPAREPASFPDARQDEATALVAEALAAETSWLDPQACSRLLDCYGIPQVEQVYVADPPAAATEAERLGGAVALKAVAPELVHKSDVGGVRLGLQGPTEAAGAAALMAADLARAGHPVDRFVVQRMAPPGVEMLVGVVHDRTFGPVVACGAGGVTAELVGDVGVRLAPLARVEASEMVRSLRAFRMLSGYRGAPPADIEGLEEIVLRVGALADAHPEVIELDCNPVVVSPDGAQVVDVRVRVEPAPEPTPLPAVGR